VICAVQRLKPRAAKSGTTLGSIQAADLSAEIHGGEALAWIDAKTFHAVHLVFELEELLQRFQQAMWRAIARFVAK
jgi:hypothetical protein